MQEIPRCQAIPLPNHEVSFQIDGQERTRWHYGSQYPRPFFFPLNGPSGETLTRMGHPGAPDHDHHRSVWFAHYKVLGIDFWGDGRNDAYVRQLGWLAYEDSNEEARMAVRVGWFDGHNPAELLVQELVVAVRDDGGGGTFLETQSRFIPKADSLEFQKTNFGFLAVRVAKSISGVFGGGTLTNSDGKTGEKAIFGKASEWMDYSGSVTTETGLSTEGVTYFDHPSNPGQPTGWHVREDGWMCASPCMSDGIVTTLKQPLQLRYLLHAHAGGADNNQARQAHAAFADSSAFAVKRGKGHVRNVITRVE
ncbi:MAG: PmoA family protein [Planctomycetaceae bacterium]